MTFRQRTFDRASKPKAFAGLGNRLPASGNTGVQRAPAPVPMIQRHHLATTSVGPFVSPGVEVIQRVNDPEKEARKRALQKQANDALRRIRDRIKRARKTAGQERFNAGYNRRVRQPPFITDGGNNSPLEIDLGDARDGFRLIDIVPAAVNSDSGLMKVTYEHQGYANILVHITRMKR